GIAVNQANKIMSKEGNFKKNYNLMPISASIGHKCNRNLRMDINVTYLPESTLTALREVTVGTRKLNYSWISALSTLTTTANLYYDINELEFANIVPYVNAGIGYSRNKLHDVHNYVNDERQVVYHSYVKNNM